MKGTSPPTPRSTKVCLALGSPTTSQTVGSMAYPCECERERSDQNTNLAGGSTAAMRNAQKAGCSIICGHTHSLKVVPVSNYTGTFFGVDSGDACQPRKLTFSATSTMPLVIGEAASY